MTTAWPEPQDEWTEDQKQDSLAERMKAWIPRERMIAIAGGAALAVVLVSLLIFTGRGKPWTARDSGTTDFLQSVFGTSDGSHLSARAARSWSRTTGA
jgi:type II secretory pathway component PulM